MMADDPAEIERRGRVAAAAIEKQVEELLAAGDDAQRGGEPADVSGWAERSRALKEALVPAHSRITTQFSALQQWAKQQEAGRRRAEQRVEQDSGQRASLAEELEQMQMEVSEAEARAAESRRRRDADLVEAEAAEGEKQRAVERCGGAGPPQPDDAGACYLSFLVGRAELVMDCDSDAARFDTLQSQQNSGPGANPRVWDDARLRELADEASAFDAAVPAREAELDRLHRLAERVVELNPVAAGWDRDLADAAEALDRARHEFRGWDKELQAELQRREEYGQHVDDYMANQRKLVNWCSEQRKRLEEQLTPGEGRAGVAAGNRQTVIEFCQSLQSRIAFMEENFAVLAGMGGDLVPGPQARIVEHALVDATTDWLKLQMFAYEKLRDTLLDEHIGSGLKEQCQAFSGWAAQKVKPFLDQVEELLRSPEDPQCLVAGALDTCKTLQRDFKPHQLIVDHLSDFEVRMDIINDHYERLKKTMLSRLTFLCLKLSAFSKDFKGKDQYEENIMNIQTWVETKDGATVSWEEVEQRLLQINRLIEKEGGGDAHRQEWS